MFGLNVSFQSCGPYTTFGVVGDTQTMNQLQLQYIHKQVNMTKKGLIQLRAYRQISSIVATLISSTKKF